MRKSAVDSLSEAAVDLEDTLIRVLYVDDETDLLKCAKKILELQGKFKVETASSVDEAMGKLRKKAFDVIVSDYLMPEKNGLQFLKKLRKRGNNVSFILFAGNDRAEEAIDALNLGADYYANKIGDPQTVYGQLGRYIRLVVERRKAAVKLKKSEEKYRKQFEEALDAIFLADAETGVIIDCNRAAMKLVGREKSELIGKHQRIIHPPEEINGDFSRTFKRHLREKEGKVLETKIITKTGEIKDVAIKANVFELGDKKVLHGVFRDITEQKRAEEALRECAEKNRELINGMTDTVWVIDFDGKFIDVNDAAVEVLGYSREELLSMGPYDIDTSLDPEEIMSLIKGMPTDEIQVFETTYTTKDGKAIPVEIKSSLVAYQGKQAILSIARDITERKKAEEDLQQIMEELTMVNEKLGVVGKLTRHDARNKLSTILNNIYLAKQTLTDEHEATKYLGNIESTCEQVAKIFDFARMYEQLGTEELSYVNVSKSFEEAVMLVSDLNGEKLVNECHGLMVLADSLLRQLFYNLIVNSLKHGEKVSQIKVYYEGEKDQLKLIYEDDGVGIPEDEKEKIFLEGYGKGTGYGLYLIKKICAAYGWSIRETGKQGKGVQFTMTIPKTYESGKITYQLQ